MEVTVLDIQNMPKRPVIAIRVGSALKHAELALNTPFNVPSRGVQDSCVKVSLYERLGTQTIPDAEEHESICNVPIRAPDGKCSQVKLQIRRGKNGVSLADAKRNNEGVEAYLNTHQLEARLQGLFETVLKKQPVDPYRCMIEELQKVRSATQAKEPASEEASAAPVPKAPVAPAEPRPQNARPSPAAKARNIKPGDSEKVADQRGSIQEDADTRAALAQFMSSEVSLQESKSLHGAGQQTQLEAGKAESSHSMAHQIMRHCLRKSAGDIGLQMFSPGERAFERKVARCIIDIVYQKGASATHGLPSTS